MKNFFCAIFAISLVATGVVLPAFADDTAVTLGQNGAPDQAIVTTNCRAAQSLISQIERADSVTRINRGQSYNDIVDLFFAMNTRVSSNNVAAPKLTELVNSLQSEISDFHTDYDNYDDSLNKLTGDDCTTDPTTFYNDLVQARTLMDRLNATVAKIDNSISGYKVEIASVISQRSAK